MSDCWLYLSTFHYVLTQKTSNNQKLYKLQNQIFEQNTE